MQYKYKFSVIVPIYNVEKYLEKSIRSITKQSIGFKKNIQLILVNDGSPDNSDEICLKYQKRYPNNIIYLKQKNQGVSVARNNGMKYIEGKYVNFFDSDDIWSKRTFSNVFHFFEEHYDDIDLVACRIKFFEGKKGYHPLDYKFSRNEVIDLEEKSDYIQLNGPTTFIKSSIVKKFKYDENLKYGEDPYFITQIILEKNKYGILNNCIYNYRKRLGCDSAQNMSQENKEFYFNPIKLYLNSICDYSIKKENTLTKYIQTLVAYELYWRLKLQIPRNMFSQNEIDEYNNLIINLTKKIDDDIIVNFHIIPLEYKIAFFILKYGNDILNKLKIKDNEIIVNNKIYKAFTKYDYIQFRKFRVEDNKLIIYGKINHIFSDSNIKFYLENCNTKEKIYAKIYKIDNWTTSLYNGNMVSKGLLFQLKISLEEIRETYKNYVVFNNKEAIESDFSSIAKFDFEKVKKAYYVIDKHLVISKESDKFIIDPYNKRLLLKKFFIRNFDLIKNKKIKLLVKTNFINPIKEVIKKNYPLKNIIILESNPDYSDSTKIIFDKLIENSVNNKYKIVWFVKDEKQFENIKIKNVEFIKYFDDNSINFRKSKIAKYYHRNAKIIIDNNKYINKVIPGQIRIHINHGSPLKNAIGYNLNIGEVDYIIVQSKFFTEVESKIRDTDINKIIPLGFPRNDILYKNDKILFKKIDDIKDNKIILWLPTYKVHKKSANKSKHSVYGLNCINNEEELIKLNEKLKKDKVTIVIKFHPAESISIFEKIALSNILVIKDEELKESGIVLYQLFNKVDALITDYSSVYFDFCLTKKNIGLAISDIDDYVKEQGNFQFKYEDVMIGNYMHNNKDLLKFVDDVAKGKDQTYKERMKLIKKYDDYRDGKSAERIYEFLKKYM